MRPFVLCVGLGGILGATALEAQTPSRPPARPPVAPSAQDTLIGRAVLGGAGVLLVKGLAVPAALGSVGWHLLQGQPLDQAVRTSVSDARQLAAKAKPAVLALDQAVSPAVGRTVRQGVREAGRVIQQAARHPDRALPPAP